MPIMKYQPDRKEKCVYGRKIFRAGNCETQLGPIKFPFHDCRNRRRWKHTLWSLAFLEKCSRRNKESLELLGPPPSNPTNNLSKAVPSVQSVSNFGSLLNHTRNQSQCFLFLRLLEFERKWRKGWNPRLEAGGGWEDVFETKIRRSLERRRKGQLPRREGGRWCFPSYSSRKEQREHLFTLCFMLFITFCLIWFE